MNELRVKIRKEQKLNYTIDACLLVMISLSVISIRSKHIHGVLGFIFVIFLILHLYLHRRWIIYMIVNGVELSKVSSGAK